MLHIYRYSHIKFHELMTPLVGHMRLTIGMYSRGYVDNNL
jgi:hypothetical protein